MICREFAQVRPRDRVRLRGSGVRCAVLALAVFGLGGFTLAPSHALAARVDVCGNIASDTVWTSDSVYVITCDAQITVMQGVVLTIQPGTVVKFGAGNNLYVYGTLLAEGTPTAMMAFTSLTDDARAGDTNGDGAGATPAPGDWGAITFQPGSKGRIAYASIEYGGAGYYYYGTKGLIRAYSNDVALDHVTLGSSALNGLYAENVSVAVTNSTIRNNASYGLFYNGFDPVLPLTVSNNIFQATGALAGLLQFNGLAHGTVTVQGNHASGGTSGFRAKGSANGDIVWDSADLPLVVGPESLTIGAGTTLQLTPGTVVKLDLTDLAVFGTLVAEGTPAAPIAFTSLQDDRVGGDTNGDGPSEGQPGQWAAITFMPGSHGRIADATAGYGGGNYYYYGSKALIRAYSSDVALEHVVLEHSGLNAVYAENSDVLIRHGRIVDNVYGVRTAHRTST